MYKGIIPIVCINFIVLSFALSLPSYCKIGHGMFVNYIKGYMSWVVIDVKVDLLKVG